MMKEIVAIADVDAIYNFYYDAMKRVTDEIIRIKRPLTYNEVMEICDDILLERK